MALRGIYGKASFGQLQFGVGANSGTNTPTNVTLIQSSWNWGKQLLLIDDINSVILVQKSWQWSPQLLTYNLKTIFTPPSKTWFWNTNLLPGFSSGVTPLLMLMGMGV